jgi:hypothetical protein
MSGQGLMIGLSSLTYSSRLIPSIMNLVTLMSTILHACFKIDIARKYFFSGRKKDFDNYHNITILRIFHYKS